MKKTFLTSVFYVLIMTAYSQTDQPVAMGEWRTHLAYNHVSQIAQSPNKIFAVSEGALFSVSKVDADMEFYSKMSGMSDANIVKIEYDNTNNQLLIIYQNGNIDIMHTAGVNNIPDLHNKQMSSSKAINDVYFYGNLAYLSCDFGILLLNMEKKEIADTYIIGPNSTEIKVLSTAIHNDTIYAVTENTVYNADANNRNLVNFEYWKPTNGLPGSGTLQQVFSFAGKLLLLRNGKLYKQEDDKTWNPLLAAITISSINVSNSKIMAGNGTNSVYILNESFEMSTHNILSSPDIEYDGNHDTYWLAGETQGVISFKLQNGSAPLTNYYKPSGPAENRPWNMTFAGEKLFVVNGGRWASQDNRTGQVMMYENGRWTNIDGESIRSVTGQLALDFMDVAVHPDDDSHFFVSSYGTGLYEFVDNQFENWYNQTNSTIHNIYPTGYRYMRLDGVIFDENNNLLIANTSSESPIKILLENGSWTELRYPAGQVPTLGRILISNQNPNQKWVPSVRYSPGIFIWDDNGTITNQNDDKNTFLSNLNDPDGGTLNPGAFFCLTQDKNGVIWAGTDMGPLLFYNPSRAFEEDYTCTRVKIPRNDGTGLADYLLENEKVKAIVVDGANRKWLGTESSGLYLMSENGQETIHHFTSSNSPLLSDNILSLAINPISGELFIGTSNGLISLQTDAAEANNIFSNVYAYPNPVRENYKGIITITGLVANTQVKITDLNGNLIYQTVSNGSIATWDGKNAQGRRVNTGVYMVICANEDGTENAISKIMFIN